MRIRLFGLIFVALLGLAGTASASVFQDGGKRIALVIGISKYENVPALPNPENDAQAVAAALERLGFEVEFHPDVSRTDLDPILAQFDQALEGADIAMFYYAGHSIQIDGENYIAPRDTVLSEPGDIERYLLKMSDITRLMDTKAAVRITVLDACRDNPFLESAQQSKELASRGLQPGLAHISGPERLEEGGETNVYGSVVAYAAASGHTASDGEGKHSPYTQAFLDNVEEPGLEIGQMFRNIASSVIQATDNEQQPEYLVRLTDEVFFKRPEPSQCDFLAAAPINQVGVKGVEFDRIDPQRAIPACEAALEKDPQHPRFLFNLGRALDAAGRYKEAVSRYKASADLGFVAAISSLGVMNMNGQGTPQNFFTGAELLKKARALGSRSARISMVSADFSILFEAPEFKAVQQKLNDEGFEVGQPDGNFGPQSKKALKAYQQANNLQPNGITLETLDSLGLVEIIPSYELN